MRRLAYWTAVLLAVAAVGAGGVLVWRAYRDPGKPAATVRAYFAALERADAPAALSYGDVPLGPHGFLTSAVLADQQRIAGLHDVTISHTSTHGKSATVTVAYRLRFASGDRPFVAALALTDYGEGWRLADSAVRVSVTIVQAHDRLTFAGTSPPGRTVVMFPGALPIRFDTPNLQVDPSTSAVPFHDGATVAVRIATTAAARATITRKLSAALAACLTGTIGGGCPTPSSRAVPGSLSGLVVGNLGRALVYAVGSQAGGVISATGKIVVQGRYDALSYNNVSVAHTGRIPLTVSVQAAAVGSLGIRFVSV